MNVEIRAEAALIPEKEYISGIYIAVQDDQECAKVLVQTQLWKRLKL
jgi:hypothetical protein